MSDTVPSDEKQAPSALIARLERASEGGRELDGAIARWFSTHEYEWWRSRGGPSNFSESVDAALTLVPTHELGPWAWCVLYPAYKREGQFGDTGMASFKYMDGKAYAGVRNPLRSHLRYDYEGYGATPALALCIAALKTRAG